MMRSLILFAWLLPTFLQAQALRDINYRYLYDPAEPFYMEANLVRDGANWQIHYRLTLRDTLNISITDLLVQWDVRPSMLDKQGRAVRQDSTARTITRQAITGKLSFPVEANAEILAVRVTHNALKQIKVYHWWLRPEYPTDGYVSSTHGPLLQPYIHNSLPLTLTNTYSPVVVSHYADDFPAATPVFAEAQARVSKGMRVDSTFTVQGPVSLSKPGLYLVQRDTNSAQGFAFRAMSDYPKFTRVENLADPLIYICTRQEFDRIKAAKGDKRAFDRVILSITGDTERAKKLMRSYFRRVELANLFFSSYKEGWKTDRGMIYMIFGPPQEVFRFADREVWNYSQDVKVSFDFARSATLFDPDNYVLVRRDKYKETWYEMIDLWRNARF